MIKVKLSTTNPDFPVIRQTPGSNGNWGNYKFYVNQDIKECDFWVVCDGLNNTEVTYCKGSILLTGEPPSVKKYSNSFVQQFDTLVTCHNNRHDQIINLQQSLPWMVGLKYLNNENRWDNQNFLKYDDFSDIHEFRKYKDISIIVSTKSYTNGHAQRIKFVNRLIEKFGSRIDVFGRGYQSIEDKYNALADYKYTIVLENCSIKDYWTEKISDAFLCNSYPIYYGCQNIFDYFPIGSLDQIDIFDIEESLKIIETVLASNKYEESLPQLKISRDLVLNKWNLFPFITTIIENQVKCKSNSYKRKKIRPERRFKKKIRSFLRSLENKLKTKS